MFKSLFAYLAKLWFRRSPYKDSASAGKVFGKQLTYRQALSLKLNPLIASLTDCIVTDTSHWQQSIDYAKMVAGGVRGTILKAGQGTGVDPYYRENRAKAKSAGLKVGSYWYYDSRVEPRKQAEIWAALVREDPGDLPHFADYEERYAGPYAGILNFTIFFTNFVRLSGLPTEKVGVYTGYYYWTDHGIVDSYYGKFWLWLAWYGPADNVIVPKPWTLDKLLFWQYTDSGDGTALGVASKEIDLSYFVKGLHVYEQMFGDTPEIPPSGEVMEGLYEVWSDVYNMSLRASASYYAAKVGDSIIRGTRMKADKITAPTSGGIAGDKWAHVIEVNGVAKDLWVAVIHNGITYCNVKDITPDTRPVPSVSIEFTDRDGKVWVIQGEMSERA